MEIEEACAYTIREAAFGEISVSPCAHVLWTIRNPTKRPTSAPKTIEAAMAEIMAGGKKVPACVSSVPGLTFPDPPPKRAPEPPPIKRVERPVNGVSREPVKLKVNGIAARILRGVTT